MTGSDIEIIPYFHDDSGNVDEILSAKQTCH